MRRNKEMSSRATQTARDLTLAETITPWLAGYLDFNCEILHFVQDDRVIGGVMHDVVLNWNEKK
jgi:hypothetical protein